MLATEFLEKYYESIEKKGLNKSVNVPQSMIIDGSEEDDGWVKWKLAESKISKFELFELEEVYKIKLSVEYKNYATCKQFLDVQIGEYTLFGINEHNTLKKIFDLFPQKIISDGYIPIGQINDENFIGLNVNNNQIVELKLKDCSFVKVLFNNFEDFFNYLANMIK